jgi:hypothetical protein
MEGNNDFQEGYDVGLKDGEDSNALHIKELELIIREDEVKIKELEDKLKGAFSLVYSIQENAEKLFGVLYMVRN